MLKSLFTSIVFISFQQEGSFTFLPFYFFTFKKLFTFKSAIQPIGKIVIMQGLQIQVRHAALQLLIHQGLVL